MEKMTMLLYFYFLVFLVKHAVGGSGIGNSGNGHDHSGDVTASWYSLRHRFSHLPGSSKGGKPMTWSHFEKLKKHDRERHRWITRKRKGKVQHKEVNLGKREERKTVEDAIGADFPLSGNADPTVSGLYWTTVSLGTPARNFSVQIDTGSDLLWVDCKPCENCPSSSELVTLAAPFDPAASSTFQEVSCTSSPCFSLQSTQSHLGVGCNAGASNDQSCYYSLLYGDGSQSTGLLSYDTFTFAALNGTSVQAGVQFGCAFNQSGSLFATGQVVDGLLGLGRGLFSVPTQLTNKGVTSGTFTHCLGGEESGGGTLILGTTVLAGTGYQSVELAVGQTSQYYVPLTAVSVNGSPLPNVDSSTFGSPASGGGTIFDSGTTLAVVPDAVYNAMTQLLASSVTLELLPLTQTSNQYCWLYNDNPISNLPKFFPNGSLQIGSAVLSLLPENYILVVASTSGNSHAACYGWQSSSGTSLSVTVLGDIILRNKLVTYDNVNNNISWSDFDCSSGSIKTPNATIVAHSSGERTGLNLRKILMIVLVAIVGSLSIAVV